MGLSRPQTLAVIGISIVIFVFLKLYVYDPKFIQWENTMIVPKGGEVTSERLVRNQLIEHLIQQRNNLSRELNIKQRKLGQMECEKLGEKGVATSNTGGWCQASSKENSGQHMTDKPLATALAQFFTGKYVASFGDGPGRYKQLLLDSGKVKGYDAYDGAPFCEQTSEGRVKYLDLTLPQYGLPLYDWVMSLEVAEHIPSQFEAAFVDNIVRHAKEGVLLSWARLGQGGYSHVNNRPIEYIIKLFDSKGFSHDEVESKKLRDAATFPWMRANVNVYRRRDTRAIDGSSHYFT